MTPDPPLVLRRDVVEVLLTFARTLRAAGVSASQERVQAMIRAVSELDVLDPGDTYWAGRLTLCGGPDDIDRYDAAFALFFGDREAGSARRQRAVATVGRPAPFELDTSAVGADTDESDTVASRASRREVLRSRDLAELSPGEREELRRLFGLLAPRVARRRSRRQAPASRGGVDRAATVRRLLSNGGEPGPLAHRRHRTRPRRLILLIDVSGSMTPYADPLLRFGHAAIRVAPASTEVFTLGTRLTRISRPLRRRDPDEALRAAGLTVPDWSGGTRLGDTLKAFLDRWGQRGMARGAVVVLCSDGWERGDPAELQRQLARLERLAHTVVWVNPHKGKDGFAPVTAGMQAALPHLDVLVAGHTFAALEELVEVIAHA
ncbi:VWA domain-containing protein [Jatrophihabitans telluris]|uniref:VWA domain-containing protein n=1 Tax=Jatrophihabitans telluris TaxID=2038343 RepID=A0ABY4R2U4_9ACTN|nr:VWA domain-containing protein [Jatrophihabitans telluris]UQX90236.1 VWA domain-containing protein [Jatrophihabitans telluris]